MEPSQLLVMIQAAQLPSLTTSEALSGICGSISLASWMVLLAPQLIENFQNGSADGISTVSVLSWLAGDAFNFIGAIWAGLLPTVIALGMYFFIADLVLMGQVLYYKYFRKLIKRRQNLSTTTEHFNDPTQPLLSGCDSSNGRNRRSSAPRLPTPSQGRRGSLSAFFEKEHPTGINIIKNAAAILGTCVAGTVGWFISYKSGAWSPTDQVIEPATSQFGAQILGYISAVLYLEARIPQIFRNYRRRSCEGLSILFFMLSLLGNFTYGAGILFHSRERSYVWANLPWLIGSFGTMAEDVIIFCQFYIYRKQPNSLQEPAVV